ncbi:hypothetical protein SAMN05421803_101511 [Nocardiopsis flavescens]|uniref:Uncharacterized protein n=1 Tax=Nocardiopsis flavescens TaxID=758803 RepID=A0A1M6BXV1_9ACTN|nr:hypothetical protein SAMN05421803_101511 [Nocardiopsis flavescens]
MRALPDTDSSFLPRGADGPTSPSVPAPFPLPSGPPESPFPGARPPGQSGPHRGSGPDRTHRVLTLVGASGAAAAALSGLLAFSPLHQAFGEPAAVGHCLHADAGRGALP